MTNTQFNTDVTFVTHLRYDSEDRITNLQKILNFYSFYFPNSKFILVEDDVVHNTNFNNIKFPAKTVFYFLQNNGIYHRTRALNYGMFKSKTDTVVSLDTDCLVDPASLDLCCKQLKHNNTAIAWPYNGFFVDVSKKFHLDIKSVENSYNECMTKFNKIHNVSLGQTYENFTIRCTDTLYKSVGGIVVFNTNLFKQIGGYNEKFIGWGAEDDEINLRCQILGYSNFRDTNKQSICFHLEHKSLLRHNNPFYQQNCNESDKVGQMSKEELISYINTWKQSNS